MRRHHLVAVLAAVALAPGAFAQTLASSDFGSGSEGWSAINGAVAFQYRDSGGDPDGFVLAADFSSTSLWFFLAPTEFLGDKSQALGGTLSFALKTQSEAAPLGGTHADVQLVGTNGVVLSYTGGILPTADWTTFAVPLLANGAWTVGTVTGPTASTADLQGVLSSLSALRIRGDYRQSIDATGLDNVVLSAVPEPASAALLAAGALLVGWRARRR